RPAGSQYDERKWSIVLPAELTRACVSLPGVVVGRRIDQPPRLPEFVLDPRCPVAVVREFLGGVFGADGHAPLLRNTNDDPKTACLSRVAYSQTTKPEHVEQLKKTMSVLLDLLGRCGVETDGANLFEFPVRRSTSSYPAATDGIPRVEVR